MIPPDVESTGPFAVVDDATGRTVNSYHELGAAQAMAVRLCDLNETAYSIINADGVRVGSAESFGGAA